MSRPNVLLLVIDCLRADFINEPGHARIPTLARLRDEGYSFRNAIAHSSTTTPSFSNILTGRYAFEHGVRTHAGMGLDSRVRMLPEMLREAGYHTYAEVSGPLGPEIGLTRGFDSYHHRDRRKTIHTDFGKELLNKFRNVFAPPWFVLLHVWALHRNRWVLPECNNRDCGDTLYGRALSSIDTYLAQLFPLLPPNTVTVVTGDHGEEITYGPWDKFQKKMRRKWYKFALKRHLTRRHYSHGLRGISDGHSSSLYEDLVKVPLIIHHPGVVPAGVCHRQVRHIDIAPTVLEIVGADVSPELTGRSVMELVRSEEGAPRDAYMELLGIVKPNPDMWISGMRVENRHKYIYAPFRKDFVPELYDLQTDPRETCNLAASQPDLAAELHAKIEALDPFRKTGEAQADEDQKRIVSRLRGMGYVD